MTDSLCPCGSSRSSPDCCARYFANRDAPTAEALMRSRYTAYVRGEMDYILATHDASTRDAVDIEASTKWSKETNWHGLEIVDTARGAPVDDTGIVEFIARGVTNGKPFAQRERSNFRRHDGHWFYVDGEIRSEPIRKAVSVGRNEPCPCGSGKKYKRCHG